MNSHQEQQSIRKYFESEPFSRREAWRWLLNQANKPINPGKVTASASFLAKEWKWHKSKVERFIRILRDETLIETVIDEGNKCLTICIIKNKIDSKNNADAISDEITETESNFNGVQSLNRDTLEMYTETHTTKEMPSIQNGHVDDGETESRQNRDNFAPKKKKEKNQKKEKEESLKEKNIPYRDIKKEKIWNDFFDQLNSLQASDVIEFAASIGIDSIRLEWELVKFKNHASHYAKPLRDVRAGFRNWLRRSVEFEYARQSRLQGHQPISFQAFLSRAVRTLADREEKRGQKEIEELQRNIFSTINLDNE